MAYEGTQNRGQSDSVNVLDSDPFPETTNSDRLGAGELGSPAMRAPANSFGAPGFPREARPMTLPAKGGL